MLKSTQRKMPAKQNGRIAIVASAYNAEYVDGMIEGALEVLLGEVELIRVPGAFEIPVAAATLARRKRLRPAAVICLGVILRGQTTHAEYVGQSVTQQLATLAVETGIPMVHEVLLLESKAQAKARCLKAGTNRGAEAAHTALAMTELLDEIG
ncbi:MAG TPA: 6,7-dimethyl-8-ribityllumazine synthase [Verrucomicrobiales bacterium]|jgi:6,7-dimethyl-8-ribityllumazine synthase|nr:6,7-dimethyl-8-ribityllumazine synthase [Verrucomicrobiales bacterium]HIL24860.1 6,7-dimethyl-8-ribityllumazine synthase [Verrucomicrobiota bacterium]